MSLRVFLNVKTLGELPCVTSFWGCFSTILSVWDMNFRGRPYLCQTIAV